MQARFDRARRGRADALEGASGGSRAERRDRRPEFAAQAASAAVDGATPLSANAYKAPMLETLVKRAILKAAAS